MYDVDLKYQVKQEILIFINFTASSLEENRMILYNQWTKTSLNSMEVQDTGKYKQQTTIQTTKNQDYVVLMVGADDQGITVLISQNLQDLRF